MKKYAVRAAAIMLAVIIASSSVFAASAAALEERALNRRLSAQLKAFSQRRTVRRFRPSRAVKPMLRLMLLLFQARA